MPPCADGGMRGFPGVGSSELARSSPPARRPDDGKPVEYEGLWEGELRHLMILVLPVIDGQVLDSGDVPVVPIPDLTWPAPDSPALAAAA